MTYSPYRSETQKELAQGHSQVQACIVGMSPTHRPNKLGENYQCTCKAPQIWEFDCYDWVGKNFMESCLMKVFSERFLFLRLSRLLQHLITQDKALLSGNYCMELGWSPQCSHSNSLIEGPYRILYPFKVPVETLPYFDHKAEEGRVLQEWEGSYTFLQASIHRNGTLHLKTPLTLKG